MQDTHRGEICDISVVVKYVTYMSYHVPVAVKCAKKSLVVKYAMYLSC
jgi:hypothetical protein